MRHRRIRGNHRQKLPFVRNMKGIEPSNSQAPRTTSCTGIQKLKTGGLMLDKLDLARVGDNAEIWEKVVRKLRAGMMPPLGLPRPNPAAYEALTVALENELDRAAAAKPHLPAPGVHRVNRTEYANAIRDLLALDIDPAAFLPADDSSYGFDNVASGLGVSPALVEGYVSAAAKISRLALGMKRPPRARSTTSARTIRRKTISRACRSGRAAEC